MQALIDALPDADTITKENAEDVKAQLTAIDEARAELTDEELDALDTTRYEVAISALMALEGMEGAEQPQTLTDCNVGSGNVSITSAGTYTITGTTSSDMITVNASGTVNITLNGVTIDRSGQSWKPAFLIEAGNTGNVTITLQGTNILKGGSQRTY